MTTIVPNDAPEDPRLFIPYIEFYITNVCNLTCSNCNRFNDYDFKGYQKWSDYAHLHEQWASRIRLQRIAILGGEPLLNPTLLDWVDGINRLWDRPVQVLTNGTRLNAFPNLYERLLAWKSRFHPNWIGVSLHNANDRERCFEEIHKFLKGNVKYYCAEDISDETERNRKTYGAQHAFIDSNGMRVCVWEYNSFYTAAIQRNSLGQFVVNNSDPIEAHQNCGFVQFKSYHFIRGQIYKCGPAALFPEFDRQHPLQISDEDRKIINSYQPLTVEIYDREGKEFMKKFNEPIPQCKFCPTKFTQHTIYAVSKKSGSTSSYD